MKTGNDKRFSLLTKTLLGLGFVRYPDLDDRRITYRQLDEMSTLDYLFIRGGKICRFEVGKFYLTQHRPLSLSVELEKPPSSNFTMVPSLGKAYVRSEHAVGKLIEAFEDLELLKSGREVFIEIFGKSRIF